MNWSYAKSIIIVLLIILNLLLYGIRINENNNKYILNSESENNIRNILMHYNYHLYTVLPTEYYPLRNVVASKRTIDNMAVAKHYLKDESKINKKNDGNKEIYYIDDSEYVEIYRNGKIVYYKKLEDDHEALSDGTITKNEAYDILTKFMGRVYKGNRLYKAVGYDKEDGVYKYYYYNTYNGTLVFNDYIKVEIYNDHISSEVWGANITQQEGERKDILPVDEAIFNFVKNVKVQGDQSSYITDIKLGYYTLNDAVIVNGETVEHPYYKISIKYYGDYFVNAYTNEIFDNNLIKISNESNGTNGNEMLAVNNVNNDKTENIETENLEIEKNNDINKVNNVNKKDKNIKNIENKKSDKEEKVLTEKEKEDIRKSIQAERKMLNMN